MNPEEAKFFAFPFFKDKQIVGITCDSWFWFYDYFIEGNSKQTNVNLESAQLLFLSYIGKQDILQGIIYLHPNQIVEMPKQSREEIGTVFFDEQDVAFKAELKGNIRPASLQESLLYSDIITAQSYTASSLKWRIMEMSFGLVPSFQYQIETTYRSFFRPFLETINAADDTFTKTKRNKKFDLFFAEKILPLAKVNGFSRYSERSKKLFKKMKNGLSVFILFEHKQFGDSSYEVTVAYFDEVIGSYEEDLYLAHLTPHFPYSSNLKIQSQNANIMDFDLDYWLRNMDLYLLPFIEKHKTHSSILSSIDIRTILIAEKEGFGIQKRARSSAYHFELPLSTRKDKCLAVLSEKATVGSS